MSTFRHLVVALVAAGVLAGCSLLPGSTADGPLPYPDGCDEFGIAEERCAAIVEDLAARSGIDPATVREIWLLDDAECGASANELCTRTTSFVVRVRFVAADGRSAEESLFCGIEAWHSYLCTDDPEILVLTPMSNGYRDVPCTGEPPAGCASPVPTAAPDALAGARPLEVAVLDVPIDHEGLYDVLVGEAVLPNGLLTETAVSLADPSPDDVRMQQPLWLDIRSLDDGSPLVNVYDHGWRPGTERVEVRLQFEVGRFEPGAVLQVRDVVVR